MCGREGGCLAPASAAGSLCRACAAPKTCCWAHLWLLLRCLHACMPAVAVQPPLLC